MSQHANALEEVVAGEPLSGEAMSVVLNAIAHIKRLEGALREIIEDDEYTGERIGHGDRGPAYADTARTVLSTSAEGEGRPTDTAEERRQ
jgi:hypothetical protein